MVVQVGEEKERGRRNVKVPPRVRAVTDKARKDCREVQQEEAQRRGRQQANGQQFCLPPVPSSWRFELTTAKRDSHTICRSPRHNLCRAAPSPLGGATGERGRELVG